ncbi:MAG TPA: hypothetical protein QGF05_11100 [Dehalococcoidia bacterium]|nr:hypothetical protein [Dehalococcoidia bacterium]
MFRHRNGMWHWNGVALPLSAMERAVLTGLIRYPGQERAPERWVALGLGHMVSPRTGDVVMRILQRQLTWLGLPERLIEVDLGSGARMDSAVEVADDLATLAALTEDTAIR